jgi:hypothetical protein
MDCAHHDFVGFGFGLHGVGWVGGFVLSLEIFAWSS